MISPYPAESIVITMPYKEPEKWREANRKSYWKHRERRLNYSKKMWRLKHPISRAEIAKVRHERYIKRTEGVVKKRYVPLSEEDRITRVKEYRIKYGVIKTAWIKFVVFNYYSNGSMRCNCPGCGMRGLKFLSMDHINGHGGKHRKDLKLIGGSEMYKWLLYRGFPDGYQVLCHSCNQAKGRWGICPHEAKQRRLAEAEFSK